MATQRPPQQGTTPATNGPRKRILRIGILLGGSQGGTPTLVEERLIRERVAVSIGQSMKNTFSVPVEGMPLELTLFAMDEGKYYLRFLPKMDGRLSDGGQVNTLEALKAKGAQNHGEYFQVPLSDSSRGKLSLGDLTVLFQFVTEPPRQPKPMLPASVRGTLADRVDPRLSVILGSSIIVHFAVVILALSFKAPEPQYTFFPPDVPPPIDQPAPTLDVVQQKVEVAKGDSDEKKPATDKKPETKPNADKKPDPGPKKSAQEIAQQQHDDAIDIANGMTGNEAKDGTAADMANRAPGRDLNSQINEVKNSGNQVAIGGGQNRGSRGDGTARTGTGHGPDIKGPGGTESAGGGKKEKEPTGRISVSQGPRDADLLDPDAVLKKIQSVYMAGIKRCYTTYLKKDASARGKITLALTVNPTGRTTTHNVNGFAPEVDSCIDGLMSSWRFPIPKDKDGAPMEANFQISLQLVPD
jgi:hypothetical protein